MANIDRVLAHEMATSGVLRMLKVNELLHYGGLRLLDSGVWEVTTTEGRVYQTTTGMCTCPATRKCYHQIAIRLMVASIADAQET